MKITQIRIQNFKIFEGKYSIDLDKNLVFFVGQNNTGKSSVFEAIDFLKSGLPRGKNLEDIRNNKAGESDHVSVTIKISGNIKNTIDQFSQPKYLPYVYEEDGIETIKVERTSENRTITQNNKPVELSIKTINIWNNETSQFENPSGISSAFSTLFETQFVWSDTNPEEVADFGKTKICGSLIYKSLGDFFKGRQWEKFADIHEETFNSGDDSLTKRLSGLEDEIGGLLESQYGKADVKFKFPVPDSTSFYKNGNIVVNDGEETTLSEKGSGMQRAIALAIIQVYAKTLQSKNKSQDDQKPIFFFLDEPEICLHPLAQMQLTKALTNISKSQQIFISTHSPFVLKDYSEDEAELHIFRKVDNSIETNLIDYFAKLTWSPTWGEVCYWAYELPTNEFHNDLYTEIQIRNKLRTISAIETWLTGSEIGQNKQSKEIEWKCKCGDCDSKENKETLMTSLRNKINHSDNNCRPIFTDEQLKDSIERMIKILKPHYE